MSQPSLDADETGLPVEGGHHPELHRAIGPLGLVSIGIGTTIGAGIFTIAGTAAANMAGPGIIISFVIAGIGCLFAALSYAELASMIPVAGSAYTYAYAALGRFIGWFIGWNLILEYGISASAVAVSWSGYFVSFMKALGITLPQSLTNAPLSLSKTGEIVASGALINVPAIAIVVLLTTILIIGVRETTRFNNLMVLIKVAIIILIIAFGLPLIHPENLTPIIPPNTTGHFGEFGWTGVLRASGTVFFAYIGFDSVSVAAQEAKNPQRDMPIGIMGTLVICTALYILMAITMTGLVSYTQLDVPNAASVAIEAAGAKLARLILPVNIAAMAGLASVVFMSLYGQTRIFYSMANDGFIPKLFAHVHPRFRTPYRGTIIVGAFAAVVAALFPLDILGDLVSIGTLAAFVTVCIAVIVLRRIAPNAKRAFRTPWVPIVPILGVLSCFGMMVFLAPGTWIRLAIWTAIGIVIYLVYGMWHAKKSKWHLEQQA
jgi:APA family basic amino acid/polyamine antiporter